MLTLISRQVKKRVEMKKGIEVKRTFWPPLTWKSIASWFSAIIRQSSAKSRDIFPGISKDGAAGCGKLDLLRCVLVLPLLTDNLLFVGEGRTRLRQEGQSFFKPMKMHRKGSLFALWSSEIARFEEFYTRFHEGKVTFHDSFHTGQKEEGLKDLDTKANAKQRAQCT